MRHAGPPRCALTLLAASSFTALANGPNERKPTDPRTLLSAPGPSAIPLPVDAFLTSTRIFSSAHSRNGLKLTPHGKAVVYNQDRGGDEYDDILLVPRRAASPAT